LQKKTQRQSEARRSMTSPDGGPRSHSIETALPQDWHSKARTSGSIQLRGKTRRSRIGKAQKSQTGEVTCMAGFLRRILTGKQTGANGGTFPASGKERSQLQLRERSPPQHVRRWDRRPIFRIVGGKIRPEET
jgi:hypothetical protein